MAKVCCLSYGAGQDSTALLAKYVFDRKFRQTYVGNARFLVICSATGDEHDETYTHIEWTKKTCTQLGIEFLYIDLDMGYHTGHWAKGLAGCWEAYSTIGSVGFPPSCSFSLKQTPLYAALEDWIELNYGFKSGRKKGLKAFAKEHELIDMWIGFADGEQNRMAEPAEQLSLGIEKEKRTKRNLWMKEAINKRFPLIDLRMNRAACQQYIRSVGWPVPVPSCCKRCCYKSAEEIMWMKRNIPDVLEAWLQAEHIKLAAWEGRTERNMGVKGSVTLAEFVAAAESKLGHLPNTYFEEYRMSHGHNVQSKY
jgi:hypothetical protein